MNNKSFVLGLLLALLVLSLGFNVWFLQSRSDTTLPPPPPPTPLQPDFDQLEDEEPEDSDDNNDNEDDAPSVPQKSYLGHGFSFTYSDDFQLTEGPAPDRSEILWSSISALGGETFVTLTLPQSFQPGTNFSEAYFTVGMSEDSQAVLNCSNSFTEVKTSNVSINRTQFSRLEAIGAAAGNNYETISYRTVHPSGKCYAVEYVIHSTNIGNYDPSQNIKEFDEKKVRDLLEEAVRSFRFL